MSKALTAFASVVFLVALSGCATVPSRDALLRAESNCPNTISRGNAVYETWCYVAADRTVWAAQSPDTLVYFDEWAARKLLVAEKFDRGEITRPEYISASREATANLQSRLRQQQGVAFNNANTEAMGLGEFMPAL